MLAFPIPTVFALRSGGDTTRPVRRGKCPSGPEKDLPLLVGHFDYQYPESEDELRMHTRNIEELIGTDFVITSEIS